ncbi:MAG TPA: hypothetical protein VFU13_08335 [Steroidobacteraceae bacterium]|nr:hypothetical protein [Steroidobacteraceae bacterium]
MKHRDIHIKLALPAAVATALAMSLPAGAAPWEWHPSIEAGYLYDDNYRLAARGDEIDVQGPLLDAELEMRTLTQKSEFTFTPRIRATYFPDETDLDAVDYFADVNWLYSGQRTRTRVRGDFAVQDIVNSEQPGVDDGGELGDPDMGDGGLVLVDNTRTRFSLRPSMNFEMSPRRELAFDVGYTDVSFDRQIPGAQVDFKTADASAALIARMNETTTLTTRVRGSRYDISTNDVQDGYGAELQWDRVTAAETRTYLRGGVQDVELPNGDSELTWLVGAGVSFLIGRNELFADLSRNVGPSSVGELVARDQLRVRWTRAMTPRLSLLGGLRGTHDDGLGDTSTYRPRSYATGDLGLQWRLQEEFSLRVALDYTWQEFEDAVNDATSSGAMITFLYQPLQSRRARND